jgi:hypothetical protein
MSKIVQIVAIIALSTVFSFSQENENKIRFGARANIGNSSVSKDEWELKYGNTVEEKIKIEGGYCFGIGTFALIPLFSIYFVPEISLEYIEPLNFRGIKVTETAIDVPLLFRFRYREENLIYLGIGPLLGLVLSSQIDDNGRSSVNNDRSRSDFGFAFELGFRINGNFSIDIRGLGSFNSLGVNEYITNSIGTSAGFPEDLTLFQGQIGVNYVF